MTSQWQTTAASTSSMNSGYPVYMGMDDAAIYRVVSSMDLDARIAWQPERAPRPLTSEQHRALGQLRRKVEFAEVCRKVEAGQRFYGNTLALLAEQNPDAFIECIDTNSKDFEQFVLCLAQGQIAQASEYYLTMLHKTCFDELEAIHLETTHNEPEN